MAYTSPAFLFVKETLPMNKLVEVVLTVLALAGMYCAMPNQPASPGQAVVQSSQQILIADGTDPMPLCRGAKACGQQGGQ